MLRPNGNASRVRGTSSLPFSADSAFKKQVADHDDGRRHLHLECEAAHWGRLLELMEGQRDSSERAQHPGEALVQHLVDLSQCGVDFSTGKGRRSVKRAVSELLAVLPAPDRVMLEELRSVLQAELETRGRGSSVRTALEAAIEHLHQLEERGLIPAGCSPDYRAARDGARSGCAPRKGRSFGSSLLYEATGCALDGRGQDLRAALKALCTLYVEYDMPRESVSMLSIQLLAQCQVMSLAGCDEMPPAVVKSVLALLQHLREPLLAQVEGEIGSLLPAELDADHPEPLPDTVVPAPSFERMPWALRSALNGVREGACHWVAMLFAWWAIGTGLEAFLGAVDGNAWPPVAILGAIAALAFIGFDQLFQRKIVNTQAFRPQADVQLGRYAKSNCFNLMRWTSLIQPWVLPIGFFAFGLVAFDARARSTGGTEFNDTAAFQPEPLQGSLPSSNASHCEIAAAMAMSTERIGYAWQCALIPVQAQIIGLLARPFRDLLQSGSRSRWSSGLSLGRCIINAAGKEEVIKLKDDEQWRVWLLRDILYAVSSVATLGIGQACGKGLISLIQLKTCLAHEAIGIEFKSVYGPMNEALDGFWPDLASKLVEWCPALVGLDSPADRPLVCVVDRQPCIVGDEHGWQKFREHFVRNASARIATASVGNDAFGALASLCGRLGYSELETFFFVVGSLFNAATGGARARTANYLADPHKCPHPDTAFRLAEVIVTRGSSASQTPLTPREREIHERLEERHAIAGAFRSGVSDHGDASGASTPTGTALEDSWCQEDHADESSL